VGRLRELDDRGELEHDDGRVERRGVDGGEHELRRVDDDRRVGVGGADDDG
jgi:hypothetical protein